MAIDDPVTHLSKFDAVYSAIAKTQNTGIIPDRLAAFSAVTLDEFEWDVTTGVVRARSGETIEDYVAWLRTTDQHQWAWNVDYKTDADTPKSRLLAMTKNWKNLDHKSRLEAGDLDNRIKKADRRNDR